MSETAREFVVAAAAAAGVGVVGKRVSKRVRCRMTEWKAYRRRGWRKGKRTPWRRAELRTFLGNGGTLDFEIGDS